MQQIKTQPASDPAASWRRYTPRQATRSAARHDREAKETIAAHKAQQLAEARAASVVRATKLVELLGVALLTDSNGRRSLTREERKVCKESVKDGWRTLRNWAGDFVTVLS